MNSLAKLELADRMLAEASDLHDIAEIRDIAVAAQAYAKAAMLGVETTNKAALVKIKAERKAGEYLKRLERGQGERTDLLCSNMERSSEYTQTLEEVQIPKTTAHRWQQMADVPDEVFAEHVEEVVEKKKELTSSGVLRIAKAIKHEQKREDNKTKIEQAPPVTQHVQGERYSTILIDPPWDWGDEGDVNQFGRVKPLYHTMPIADIARLPIPDLARDNAHLYMWITNRSLPKGFILLEQWGFRYITALTWCKPSIGTGNYFRGSTEHLLFAVRGSLPLLANNIGTWFEAPRGINGHSSKPTAAYELIEKASPSNYLEMFSRTERKGWAMWGEQS
jgi:N6-adenosine-specific RNA methylase IME4